MFQGRLSICACVSAYMGDCPAGVFCKFIDAITITVYGGWLAHVYLGSVMSCAATPVWDGSCACLPRAHNRAFVHSATTDRGENGLLPISPACLQ